jgi:hypothetical protein
MVRTRIRFLLLFTPWVTVPLALLGVYLALLGPLMLWTRIGWILYSVGIAGAIVLAGLFRRRYRLSILDSTSLGVMTWLQRRI